MSSGRPNRLHSLPREVRSLPQALHMLGAAFILFVVVGLFTARNIQQTDTYVSGLMAERGKAIIELFEGSLRNELRMRSGLRVQEFLEDLSSSEDIRFIALVLDDGTIMAHSNPERVGHVLRIDGRNATPESMRLLKQYDINHDEDAGSSRRLLRVEDSLAYLLHHTLSAHQFSPILEPLFLPPGFTLPKSSLQLKRYSLPRAYLPELQWSPVPHGTPQAHFFGSDKDLLPPRIPSSLLPPLTSFPSLEILVGLDAMPLIKMQEQNMRSAVFSGVLVLMAGLALMVALRYVERGVESRRRMRVAETLAQNMVDEVRRLEKEMRRREKQAAVGDLAAGVAHELRNPLSSIKGYATYFRSRFPEGSEDRESAQIMVQEVDRLNRVISDLIGVSKPTDIHPVATDMGQLLEGTIRLLAQDAGQRGVALRQVGEPITVFVDPDRMRQALLNVCLNAVEAMADGGEIVLALSREDDMAHLEITDNGPGIPPSMINRIFDPYFTTKSQGTGLGLMMVLKIAEAHDGTVQVSSEEGVGTTVLITLPLLGDQSPASNS